MPNVTYNATGFPPIYGPTLDGVNNLSVTWPELVWAAVSVGKAQLQDLALYGVFSALEMTYRIAIIYANLRQTAAGNISRSAAYDGLDPSEKGAISYFIGLTVAKLFASRLMNVPWLMHLDVYRQILAPVLLSQSKPDLVGLTTAGEWVVVEAKGRTNDFVNSVLTDAKLQTQQLTTIQGVAPILRVASLSYFNSAGILQVALSDPSHDRPRLPNLPLTPELIVSAYYRPFEVRIGQNVAVTKEILDGESFNVAQLRELDMWIGLSELPRHPAKVPDEFPSRVIGNTGFVGRDGILVRLGSAWSEANMGLQPQERSAS